MLLPVLRSRHQGDILAELLLNPDREYSIADLSTRLSIPQSTASGEVRRLADAGILTVRTVGRSRLARANAESKLVRPLTELLALTFGPHVVISEEFATLPGAELVLIYGSWAARYHGQHGPPPGDVDVLVVGSPDRTAVHNAAARAERRLDRPVNPVLRSPERWVAAADPLIHEIKATSYVTILDHRTVRENA